MKRKFNAAKVPQFIALESVSVASPCHADWNAMTGDDRSRFCPSCAKNVYNLSAMTREEAQLLLQEKNGRLCVRFFQREDGTMLTQDCPVGVAVLKERSPSFALWAGVASLALIAVALLSPSLVTGAHAQPDPHGTEAPTQTSTPDPTSAPVLPALETRMGDFVAVPQATAVPSPTPAPTAVPTLSRPVPPVMGKIAISIPSPTPKLVEVRGRPSIAKQVPPPATMMLGEMAVVTPKTTPTHKPEPTMGSPLISPKKSQPSRKTSPAKKRK